MGIASTSSLKISQMPKVEGPSSKANQSAVPAYACAMGNALYKRVLLYFFNGFGFEVCKEGEVVHVGRSAQSFTP